ncbi:hypothetical protein OSB04_031487 [Centaurea solstitialis]|uniref:Uncharacterized protein n=1 Tax=Centaurea solstitialis TaxID=347529 RepID=A0AA38S927_9ASTR|nr:hypothetical protein OSB04_031487 [Centaurea solstitialis]
MKKDWKLYDRLMRRETGIGGTRSLIEASPEWWEEKIKVDKEYAKFRETNLSIYETHYAPLFRDLVAIGDQTMTPGQFQNNSNMNDGQSQENVEGKGDSDEINLGKDEPLFPSFPDSSSSKKKNDCMNIAKKFPGFNEGSKEMDSDDSDFSYDENEEYSNEDDIEFRLLCGLVVQGILLGCNIRIPCHTSDRTGHMFINEILNGHPRLVNEILNGHPRLVNEILNDHPKWQQFEIMKN